MRLTKATLQALVQAINDGGFDPYINVYPVTAGTLGVPPGKVKDNRITLNLAYRACENMHFGPDGIVFKTRFDGRSYDVWVPYAAILTIWARGCEDWQGTPMMRSGEEEKERSEYIKTFNLNPNGPAVAPKYYTTTAETPISDLTMAPVETPPTTEPDAVAEPDAASNVVHVDFKGKRNVPR